MINLDPKLTIPIPFLGIQDDTGGMSIRSTFEEIITPNANSHGTLNPSL